MKQFNKFRRMLLSGAVMAVAIALTLGGCTKVDDTLGGNLIPDNQQMKAGFVRLPKADEVNPKRYVETRLFQTDSILGSNISYGYMGSQLNDTLGRRQAGFLSQMISYYKVDSGYFGYRPIFDSAQIILSVKSFGTDTTTVQTFAVYEINSNKYLTEKPLSPGKSERDTTFYLNFDAEKAGVYDKSKKLFTFTLGGDKHPSTTTSVTMEPTDEGKTFIRRLMLQEGEFKGDYSIYSRDSLEQWVEAFKGLYICPDPDAPINEYGKGTIYSTELESSGFAVFGRNRVKDDPTLIKDTIGMVYYFYTTGLEYGNVSVNSISHDYTQATTAQINIEQAKESNPDRELNSRIYVEGMNGVISEMTFKEEFFEALEQEIKAANEEDGKDFRTMAFSQVRMSIYFNDSDYDWETIDPFANNSRLLYQMNTAPNRLGLYTNYKKLSPIPDYAYTYEQSYGSSVTLAYGGYVNRSRGCYVMDITGYVQKLWNSYMKEKAAAANEGRAINWDNVPLRKIYIGPEAYSVFSTSFGVLQGMATDGSETTLNNAPIRFEMMYNLIK